MFPLQQMFPLPARGDAFGGSVEVQRAHKSAARDVASGGGNQEVTGDGYDSMVRSFESWAMFALPDAHPEHARVKAMHAALERFDKKSPGSASTTLTCARRVLTLC